MHNRKEKHIYIYEFKFNILYECLIYISNMMNMSKKSFDSKTAKKLINEYAEKINILTRENQLLKKQLEDAHTSLKLNKDILYTHFSQKVNKDSSQLIIDLQKENTRLSEKVESLYKEKVEATKTIYKLQEELEDKTQKERDLSEKEKSKKFVDDNKLIEKENKIIALQKQLDKIRHNSNNKDKVKIVYIGDPNKFNVEMNSELVTTRTLIKKYSALLQREKLTTQKLNSQIKDMENNLKSTGANTNKNSNEINVMDCIFSDNDDEEEDFDDNDIDDESDEKELPDEQINFPEKIKRIQTVENSKGVPKLDLSSVMSKYKVPDNLKVIEGVKKTNRSHNDEYVDKLKAQIKIFKTTIVRYKERIKKLRMQISSLKNNNSLLKSMLKNNQGYNGSNNNKEENDVSMNPNVSHLSDRGNKTIENINNNEDNSNIKNLDDINIKE